jgi:hypothetical protein
MNLWVEVLESISVEIQGKITYIRDLKWGKFWRDVAQNLKVYIGDSLGARLG